MDKHPLIWQRYLRRKHKLKDRPTVFELIYNVFPDEGRGIVENYSYDDKVKKKMLVEFLYYSPQITAGVFADQRMGKDALICEVFQNVIDFCKLNELPVPRFVTLGNVRCPPFVKDEDMYFSFKNIPVGSSKQEVWIYSSEIETVLPARDPLAAENKLFAQLEGTLAQNHQKLFGCVKLASKVDLNFLRGMNVKLFKFISPEKLAIEGSERAGILSPLGLWLIPKDRLNKKETLIVFDNKFMTVNYDLPFWWTQEYSEQFKDVPIERVWDYVDVMISNGLDANAISIAVAQKFRKNLTREQIKARTK